MIPTSPWSWSKLKLGWRHVPATCFCRPIYGCPWEGWDSTYNHSVDFLPWCRLSTTDQTHLLTMVGLFILFRLRTRGFFFCQETIVIPDEPTPQKKMDPESEDRFNYKNCVICTASFDCFVNFASRFLRNPSVIQPIADLLAARWSRSLVLLWR